MNQMDKRISRACQFVGWVAVAAITVAATTVPLGAQGSIETGSISGSVADDTGAFLPGVTITVRNLATNQPRTVVTNEHGLYRLSGLTPSKYSLTAELSGFATIVRPELTLNVGAILDVVIVMHVAAVRETVVVRAEAPIVERTKTGESTVISSEQIQLLPTNGRNYLDFVLLTPAAVENRSTTSQGAGVNIGGARSYEAALLVDGFYNMDEGFALPRQRYSQDAIQEFQVVTMGATAEFGRAIGGIVNAVTKSGSNRLGGTGFGFFRDTALNAQTVQEKQAGKPKSKFDRQQYGGTIAGPILRDRTFFFGSFERQSEDTPFYNNITTANAAAIGLPAADAGTIPSFMRQNFGMLKVDHQLTANQRLQGTFVLSRWTEYNRQVAFETRSRGLRLHGLDIAYQFKWTAITHQGRWVHELKAAYFPREYGVNGYEMGGPPLVADGGVNIEPITNASPPRVNITNVARFGTANNNSLLTDPVQVIYGATTSLGNHNVHFGVDFMSARFDHTTRTALPGVYTFGSLANFLIGKYSNYTQSFGDPRLILWHHYGSAYVQDSWSVNSRLTLNYGLRYDIEIQPKYKSYSFGKDYNNIGPRLALSLDLTGKGKTFLKVSSGVYYDRLFLNLVTSPPLFYSLKQDPKRFSATWTYGQAGAPVYPNVFSSVPANAPVGILDLWLLPDKLEIPSSTQVVTTLDHAFTPDLAVSVSFLYSRGRNSEIVFDRNLAFDQATERWVRPDPTIRTLSQYSFQGKAKYEAGVIEVRKRLTNKFSITGSVTVARSYDQGNTYTSQPVDIRYPGNEWGPSADMTRVRGVVSGSYEINRFLQLSGSYRGRSGYPFDPRAGASYDLNGDGAFNDRTPGFGRNSFRGPGTQNVDGRFMFTLPFGDRRLQFLLEGFNLLNRANVLDVSSTYGPTPGSPLSLFGTPLTYYPPRQLQLGVRLAF